MADHDTTTTLQRRQRPALTDALARTLPPLPRRIIYDGGPNRIGGFGLRLSLTDRSWLLNYVTTGGRERRLTIGDFPTWSAKQARARATELRRLVKAGGDPLEEQHATRSAPTMVELLALYEEIASSKRSWRDDRAMIEAYIRPRWESRKVASITPEDVEALHREIGKRAPIRANRVVSLVSAVFKIAVRRKWAADNPCRGIERNRETKRERYLDGAELARLLAVLDAWPDQTSATAIRLLLLTGCRKSELLRATSREFDLDAGLWIKPSHVKAQRSHTVPLSPQAVAELRRLHPGEAAEGLVFVNNRGNAWSEIAAWPAIRSTAELADFRLHDLRHSAASIMASGGLSLAIVGKVLGHPQTSTTQRYAHIADHAARGAVADLGLVIGSARLRLVS